MTVRCGDCRHFVRDGRCGYLDTPEGQAKDRPFAHAPFWVWSDCYSDKEQVRRDVTSACVTFALPMPPMGSADDPGKPIVDGAADLIDWKSRALSLDREGIARIIDPKAWARFERNAGVYAAHVSRAQRYEWDNHFVAVSLSKADAIIELIAREALSPPLMGGETDGSRAVTDRVSTDDAPHRERR